MAKAPGKSDRKGISLFDLFEMFPTEKEARKWLEDCRWGDTRHCPHCGSVNTNHLKSEKPMPYQCNDCRKFFSVRTNTVMAQSKVPLQKWVFAIYMWATSLKGVSSMKLHRDLKITQKTAWFMTHRLREAFVQNGGMFAGPAEADETYIGGIEKNKHASKKLRAGRGSVGKTAVLGIKDRKTNEVRAKATENTDKATLQSLVKSNVVESALVYTDDNASHQGMENHAVVRHSSGQYVDGDVHTNGIESFWSMFDRAYVGTFHHMSEKHLQRYLDEFTGRHNLREKDTIDQMSTIVAKMVGRRLTYNQLIGK